MATRIVRSGVAGFQGACGGRYQRQRAILVPGRLPPGEVALQGRVLPSQSHTFSQVLPS